MDFHIDKEKRKTASLEAKKVYQDKTVKPKKIEQVYYTSGKKKTKVIEEKVYKNGVIKRKIKEIIISK